MVINPSGIQNNMPITKSDQKSKTTIQLASKTPKSLDNKYDPFVQTSHLKIPILDGYNPKHPDLETSFYICVYVHQNNQLL